MGTLKEKIDELDRNDEQVVIVCRRLEDSISFMVGLYGVSSIITEADTIKDVQVKVQGFMSGETKYLIRSREYSSERIMVYLRKYLVLDKDMKQMFV